MEIKLKKLVLGLVTLSSFVIGVSCGQISLRRDSVQLLVTFLNSQPASNSSIITDCPLPSGIDSIYGCMPINNISGKIYSANLLIGNSTETPYQLGPIFGVSNNPAVVKSLRAYRLLDFNNSHSTQFTAQFNCCEETNKKFPESEQTSILGLALYVGYLDFYFSWGTSDNVLSTLHGNHIIRVVYANMGDLGYRKGDILYKEASATDFNWCTNTSDCTHTSRPDLPIQWSEIVGFVGTEEYLNKVLPQFFIKALNPPLIYSNELKNRSKSWDIKVTMNHSQGIIWLTNPANVTKMSDAVNNIRLITRPGNYNYPYPAQFEVIQTYPNAEPSIEPSETL